VTFLLESRGSAGRRAAIPDCELRRRANRCGAERNRVSRRSSGRGAAAASTAVAAVSTAVAAASPAVTADKTRGDGQSAEFFCFTRCGVFSSLDPRCEFQRVAAAARAPAAAPMTNHFVLRRSRDQNPPPRAARIAASRSAVRAASLARSSARSSCETVSDAWHARQSCR
jgi:hypothetical protein